MANPRPEMQAYLVEYRLRSGPLIAEFEAIIKLALRNDPEFDASSPVMVRGVQLRTNGGIKLVPNPDLMIGRPKPQSEGSWTPDRQLLAELLARTLENRSRRWLPDERRYMPMPDEWPTVLRKKWPDHFRCELSIGAGWVDLLLAVLTWLLELGAEVRWSQIKEKFGGIRIYYDGDAGTVGDEITTIAEHSLSFCICEVCGAPGQLSIKKGWHLTRCNEHLVAAG